MLHFYVALSTTEAAGLGLGPGEMGCVGDNSVLKLQHGRPGGEAALGYLLFLYDNRSSWIIAARLYSQPTKKCQNNMKLI